MSQVAVTVNLIEENKHLLVENQRMQDKENARLEKQREANRRYAQRRRELLAASHQQPSPLPQSTYSSIMAPLVGLPPLMPPPTNAIMRVVSMPVRRTGDFMGSTRPLFS